MINKHYYFLLGHSGWGQRLNDVAIQIQNKDKSCKFSGMTFGDEAFHELNEQTSIKYEDLKKYEKLYIEFKKKKHSLDAISKLENKYGSIWKYAYSDRQLITYSHGIKKSSYSLERDSILNILQAVFEYYEYLIGTLGVNVFVVYAAGSVWAQVASAVANYHKIGFYELTTIRIPDRVVITSGGRHESIAAVNQSPSKEDIKIASDALYNAREQYQRPVWVSNTSEKRSKITIKKIINLLNFSRNQVDLDSSDPGSFTTPFRIRVSEWLLFKLRYTFPIKIKNKFNNSCKIIVFPLHYEPEASLSVRGLFYSNQLSLIENISKSLPVDSCLFVKEHPQMVGRRARSFYKKMMCIPNIQLVPFQKTSRELIDESSLVITISGTTGIEAALLGKPTLMLGTTFYNDSLPGVYGFDGNLENLHNTINKIIKEYKFNHEATVDVLSTYVASSIPISQSGVWDRSSKLDDGFTELLADHIYQVCKINTLRI
jgi:hypothetical protein